MSNYKMDQTFTSAFSVWKHDMDIINSIFFPIMLFITSGTIQRPETVKNPE